jgi:hypothetical protein
VADVAVELDERTGIQKLDQALAREQLPLLPLALDRLVGRRMLRLVPQLVELVELLIRRVRALVSVLHYCRLTLVLFSPPSRCLTPGLRTGPGWFGRSLWPPARASLPRPSPFSRFWPDGTEPRAG